MFAFGRAPRRGALSAFWARLAGLALLFPAALPAALCPPDRIDERVAVDYVIDGDTVALSDGRHLRLIGVDTPELGRDGAPPEPLAEAARERLRGRLSAAGDRIALRYDAERRDRYGRALAHAFVDDGESLSGWLLEEGLAAGFTVPPNLWNLACYRRAEGGARAAGRGVWALPRFRPVESQSLAADARGFHIVRGTVERVGEGRHSMWLNLAGPLALRIDRRDLAYFEDLDPRTLAGRRIEARGWIHVSGDDLRMRVRHPIALERME